MNYPKRVLSVTAHPDDDVLGFGATASLLASKGVAVTNCILSSEVTARKARPSDNTLAKNIKKSQEKMGASETILGNFPNIEFNTVPHLDMVQFIEGVIESIRPQWLFTHWNEDLNNDHYHTNRACLAAARLMERRGSYDDMIEKIFLMEIPSSTDWSYAKAGRKFSPNTYIEISDSHLQTKLESLSCYENVMRPYPHPRSNEAIEALAKFRGSSNGVQLAESFECIHTIYKLN